MSRRAALGLALLFVAGCPTEEQAKARAPEDFGAPTKGEPIAVGTAIVDHSKDPPEVTRSGGHKGGIVVLWPHVVPASTEPAAQAVAARVQQRLADLAHRAGGARHVDVRPEPEAICPAKDGCEATSVSAVIVMKGATCAVAALMAGPKKSPAHLLKWSGQVDFTKDIVGVGEQPDPLVKVKEFVPCDTLLEKHENEEAALARYIVGLLPGR